MSLFDFLQRKKEHRKNRKDLDNKLEQERKEKEQKVGEKLIPIDNVSIILFKEDKKLSDELRVFEINEKNRFDMFVPVIKAGEYFYDMKGLERVEIFHTTKINGYDLKGYNFLGTVDLGITTKSHSNDTEQNSFHGLEFTSSNVKGNTLFFNYKVPEYLQHVVDDIKNGYIKIKDLLEIFNSIQTSAKEKYDYKLKTSPSIVKKYESKRFIEDIKKGKTGLEDLNSTM